MQERRHHLHSKMYLLIPVPQLPSYHLYLFFSFCRPLCKRPSYPHIFYYNFTLSSCLSRYRPPYILASLLIDISPTVHQNSICKLYFAIYQDCKLIISSISTFININLIGKIFFFSFQSRLKF